jgi:hypothetical protein
MSQVALIYVRRSMVRYEEDRASPHPFDRPSPPVAFARRLEGAVG